MPVWINIAGYIGFVASEGYDEYVWSWDTSLAENLIDSFIIQEFITTYGFIPGVLNLPNRLYLYPLIGQVFQESDLKVKLKVRKKDCWYEIEPVLNCDPIELVYSVSITPTTYKVDFSLIYIAFGTTVFPNTIEVIVEDAIIVGETSNFKIFNDTVSDFIEVLRGDVTDFLVLTIEVVLPNECKKKFLINWEAPKA
jgi:hypothetical protein